MPVFLILNVERGYVSLTNVELMGGPAEMSPFEKELAFRKGIGDVGFSTYTRVDISLWVEWQEPNNAFLSRLYI